MLVRSLVATGVLLVAAASAVPAEAAHRHHHAYHSLTVTRSRGLAVPSDPLLLATPNFTGSNGVTTDVNVFPDLSVGDGFPGTQTPGLDSYGLAGGGLTPYDLR